MVWVPLWIFLKIFCQWFSRCVEIFVQRIKYTVERCSVIFFFYTTQVTLKKLASLSCAQKTSRLCPSYLFRSNLTPGSSTGSTFSTVMDKAVLAAAAPGGSACGDPEASGSMESSGPCTCRERCEGGGRQQWYNKKLFLIWWCFSYSIGVTKQDKKSYYQIREARIFKQSLCPGQISLPVILTAYNKWEFITLLGIQLFSKMIF